MVKGELRHPTQIYESIFCFLLFILLWKMRTKIKREGDLFKIFLLAYSLFRFLVEFLRQDAVNALFGLSIAQLISGAVFCSMLIYFWRRRETLDA